MARVQEQQLEVVKRRKSVRTAETCEKLQAAIEVALRTLLRRHASSLCFLLSTAHRMLKHDLGYQPYKMLIVQE